MVFVRMRSSLPDKHDPASRAIKACVGWLKPCCLAKSALPSPSEVSEASGVRQS